MAIKQCFRARATARKAGLWDAAEKYNGTEKWAVPCDGIRRTDSSYVVRSGSPEGHNSGQDYTPIAGGSAEAPVGSVFSIKSSSAPDLSQKCFPLHFLRQFSREAQEPFLDMSDTLILKKPHNRYAPSPQHHQISGGKHNTSGYY